MGKKKSNRSMVEKRIDAEIDLIDDYTDKLRRYRDGEDPIKLPFPDLELRAEDKELKALFVRLNLNPKYVGSWRIATEILLKASLPRPGRRKGSTSTDRWTPLQNEKLKYHAAEVKLSLPKDKRTWLGVSKELIKRPKYKKEYGQYSAHTIRKQIEKVYSDKVTVADEIFKTWRP